MGLVLCLARFLGREPGTLLRAVSLADLVKLASRLVAPAATGASCAGASRENPLEIEARAVAEWFGRPITLRDVKPIEFPHVTRPQVSIVIPVWNRWQFTYKCLAAIAANMTGLSYEVVVVDNGSTDETRQILDSVRNIRVVRNETNLGFLLASNAGAEAARGTYVLFLNNDAHILSGTVSALLSTIRSDPTVGAVGGRLIFLDGRLQEAGSIIWSDGSCLGYGRGDDPFDPQYSYVRDVGFCSGALLLTPRELFLKLGKFDERYAPAYYEDADYCMSLRADGLRVMYQPAAIVVHHEYGSAPRREAAMDAQLTNRGRFVEKWASVLDTHLPPSESNVLRGRDASLRSRLLFVDDGVPDPRLGGGNPRAYRMLTSLRELEWAVTVFPLNFPEVREPCTSELQACGIEVITGPCDRTLDLQAFLEHRPNHYDVVLVSRPHNMEQVLPFLRAAAPDARIVYDAEALFSLRELQLLRLRGHGVDDAAASEMIADEVRLVRAADAVTAVSAQEARTLRDFGVPGAHVVGHTVELRPTAIPFAERADLLFVGALHEDSPNEDAILYFVREILPLIRQRLDCTLFVLGTNQSKEVAALDGPGVRIVGAVDDLTPWYSRVRAFVVPTRYAAGVPIKLYEASAFGLPSIVTPLIAEQVGWRDGQELVVGASPEDFARRVLEVYSNETLWQLVRSGARAAVRRDCSKDAFVAALQAATGVPQSSNPRWVGSCKPDLLIAGHSHRYAFIDYWNRSGQTAPVAVLETPSRVDSETNPYWTLALLEARKRGLPLGIVWDGNRHNTYFMLEADGGFSVFPATGPWEDGHSRPLIPRSLIREFFAPSVAGLRNLLAESVGVKVMLFGTPPPKADDHIRGGVRHEPFIVELASRLGMTATTLRITPLSVRVELWKVTQELLSCLADEFAATFIAVPDRAFSRGALAAEASAPDATHANAIWAEIMLHEAQVGLAAP